MQNGSPSSRAPRIAVAGMGYWGKNLVRNFSELGALSLVCDANVAVEGILARDYPGVRYCRDFSSVLSDPTISAVALATPAA